MARCCTAVSSCPGPIVCSAPPVLPTGPAPPMAPTVRRLPPSPAALSTIRRRNGCWCDGFHFWCSVLIERGIEFSNEARRRGAMQQVEPVFGACHGDVEHPPGGVKRLLVVVGIVPIARRS